MTEKIPPRVASLGAYDRFNYGDLMFPLVLDYAARELGQEPLVHVATRRSDQGTEGARPTVGVREFARGPQPDALVLGGGEILGATWAEAAISVAPIPLDLVLLAFGKVLPKPLFDMGARSAFGGTSPTPYVPGDVFAKKVRVVTNAIGASSLVRLRPALRDQVVATFRQAAYVSVRDAEGAGVLADAGVDAHLAPDSVAILARLHPRVPSAREDLVIQASRAWLRKDGDDLARSISEIAPQFAKVSLLPIGLAGGHGDAEGLIKIRARLEALGVKAVRLERPQTVWDIADRIADAGMFIGSSLHGAITSLAYGTPHVALGGINKLSAYLKTWGTGVSMHSTPGAGVPGAVERARAVSAEAREDQSEYLAEISWSNTRSVMAAAHGESVAN